MNILFTTLGHVSKMRGGIDRVTDILSCNLQVRGHNVFLLSVWHPAEGESLQVNQFVFPSPVINDRINILFIDEFVKMQKIDVIINQSDKKDLFDLLLIVRADVYLISTYHTDPKGVLKSLIDYWGKWRLNNSTVYLLLKFPYYSVRNLYRRVNRARYLTKKYRFFYEHSDAIVLLSDRFKKIFQEISHIEDNEKLFAISNPYSFSIEEDITLLQKDKIVLFVGRLEFSPKRLDRLLEIWQYMPTDNGWRLIIIGDGPDRELFEKLSNDLKLTNVCYLGQTDPAPYYKKASVLCVTSTFEGFGLVITEALQNEVIPIAFDSFESVHDIIENGQNGFLVKPFNLRQYYKILKRLMDDEQIRKNTRQNIRKYNLTNTPFDICKIVVEWENLLFNIINESK